MKKIILSIIACSLVLLGFTGCGNKISKDALKFKEEYEYYNGKKNASGTDFRKVNIKNTNPFVHISAEDAVEKIKNQETFYLYVGDKQCPWCRSSIEKAIEVASKMKIKKIYYINIWDDDHNEILRDKYTINEKNKIALVNEGTESYKKLLEYFDNFLPEYTLTDNKNKKVEVGEKRIFAPNYFYIENGVVVKFVTGTSELQRGSNDPLTNEILKDQEKQFNELFDN